MLMEHAGKRPRVAPSAYVAPTAMICGDVTIGEGVRVLFGAVVVAEGGRVDIGAECIIMEHAVIRGVIRTDVPWGVTGMIARYRTTTSGDSAFGGPGGADIRMRIYDDVVKAEKT